MIGVRPRAAGAIEAAFLIDLQQCLRAADSVGLAVNLLQGRSYCGGSHRPVFWFRKFQIAQFAWRFGIGKWRLFWVGCHECILANQAFGATVDIVGIVADKS